MSLRLMRFRYVLTEHAACQCRRNSDGGRDQRLDGSRCGLDGPACDVLSRGSERRQRLALAGAGLLWRATRQVKVCALLVGAHDAIVPTWTVVVPPDTEYASRTVTGPRNASGGRGRENAMASFQRRGCSAMRSKTI